MREQPVNLNLLTISFPLTAVASILHRISGLFLFLVIPFFLEALALSLKPQGFSIIQAYLSSYVFIKILILFFSLALFYHLLAGIRHLIMDMGVAEKLTKARFTALVVFFLSILLTSLIGIYLW